MFRAFGYKAKGSLGCCLVLTGDEKNKSYRFAFYISFTHIPGRVARWYIFKPKSRFGKKKIGGH
jgi:hypothetical protein